jgi:aminopeptidase N
VGLLGTVLLQASFFDNDDVWMLRQGVAHELGHTYWGNIATAGYIDSSLKFFHESFAEYTMWRGLGELYGDDYRTAGSRMNAVWYMYGRPGDEDIAVLSPAIGNSPVMVHVVYHKGSTVLRTFEEAASVETWTEGLRSLLQRGYMGLSPRAFREDMEAVGFDDAERYMDQWLYGVGYPQLVASTDIEESSEENFVTLTIDTDWSSSFVLPVVLRMADGSTYEERIVVGADTVAHFRTSTRPVQIELDPRWTAVRLVEPGLRGDVSLDGRVDAVDMMEVAFNQGGYVPPNRRIDGHYDPLYDLDQNGEIDAADLRNVHDAALNF